MARTAFPPWLKKRLPAGGLGEGVRKALKDLNLNTVCQGAHCPNQCECYARGTATFMILGSICTRSCRFCAVHDGRPEPLDPQEPQHVAQAAEILGLKHVVVTSVTRDDLPDGGAEHFARTIRALRGKLEATIEVLTPDFEGRMEDVDTVLAAGPDVFNHNVETVPRMYPDVRPQADFERSLDVLRHAAGSDCDVEVKSGLMAGVGETQDELAETFGRLAQAGCTMLTIGQYLRPSEAHLPVVEFVTPEKFEEYAGIARAMGIRAVASGPFVRSSYRADEMLQGRAAAGKK